MLVVNGQAVATVAQRAGVVEKQAATTNVMGCSCGEAATSRPVP